jgi:phosphoglycerate dehydrogenase-like enzyme
VPHLTIEPDEPLHVLVPSTAIGEAVEAVSPRIHAHRVNAEEGPPTGDAALAQVWVPRSAGAVVPDGFVEALPRLRLVQLLSAGAEKFVGRLPEGVLLCNARGAHTPSTAEWAVAATLAAQRGIPYFVQEQAAGRWSSSWVPVTSGRRSAGCWPGSTSS